MPLLPRGLDMIHCNALTIWIYGYEESAKNTNPSSPKMRKEIYVTKITYQIPHSQLPKYQTHQTADAFQRVFTLFTF